MASVIAYHGTVTRFDHFRRSPAGTHLGTLDQAAHVATQKLARLDLSVFEALPVAPNGFRGVIAEVAFDPGVVHRVDDARTAEAWEKVIRSAQRAGADTLVYANEYEGRVRADSFVVLDPSRLTILRYV